MAIGYKDYYYYTTSTDPRTSFEKAMGRESLRTVPERKRRLWPWVAVVVIAIGIIKWLKRNPRAQTCFED